MAKKKYCTKLQEDKHVKTFYGKKKTTLEFPVVFFWNCSAYVKTFIIYSIESCATAVPDVSNLD